MWLALPLLAVLTGCVRVYQPMSGLHRPMVIDTTVANFNDVRLRVHCVPEDLLNGQEASKLCQKVGSLFENQGAKVSTIIGANLTPDDLLDEQEADAEQAAAEGEEPRVRAADLTIELRARRIHKNNDTLRLAISLATFTLLPAVSEETFAQDIVVRDGTGFLLATETLQGRLVRRFGAGAWAGNALLNVGTREKPDRITAKTADEDLSSDLYQQLSQITFNAKMHWQVLQQIEENTPSTRASQEDSAWR